jgi:hypothetical protein
LRGMLSRRVKLRTTPELRFSRDPVSDQVSRLDELLRGIDTDVEVPPGTGGIEEAERAEAERAEAERLAAERGRAVDRGIEGPA